MKPRIRPKLAHAPTVQPPILPERSKRGRPRLPNPLPANERAAASRKKRVEAGARRIELMLPPETAGSLDALAEHFGESRTETINRLIRRAAARLPRKPPPDRDTGES